MLNEEQLHNKKKTTTTTTTTILRIITKGLTYQHGTITTTNTTTGMPHLKVCISMYKCCNICVMYILQHMPDENGLVITPRRKQFAITTESNTAHIIGVTLEDTVACWVIQVPIEQPQQPQWNTHNFTREGYYTLHNILYIPHTVRGVCVCMP
jgi:hypothetical protein